MPRIEQIVNVEYSGLEPYHFHYDNLPLKHINAALSLVNAAVDRNEEILQMAKGTAGDVANRLSQSINDDGSLISTAVDDSLHLIGAHEDGEYLGVEYVRMLESERNKLTNISDEATSLFLHFETDDVVFGDETVIFQDSDTITFTVTAPNLVKAEMVFPDTAAHEHYYDLTPVHADIITPDYINYKVNSISSAYIEGSLRVYINGIRLSENTALFVYPYADGPTGTWYKISYVPDHSSGTFSLVDENDDPIAIAATDIMTVDFDISLI